jgi:hypothetical protein
MKIIETSKAINIIKENKGGWCAIEEIRDESEDKAILIGYKTINEITNIIVDQQENNKTELETAIIEYLRVQKNILDKEEEQKEKNFNV